MLTQNINRIINNEIKMSPTSKTFVACCSPSVWKYSSSSTSVRSSASNKVKGSPFCSSPGNLPLAENFYSGDFFEKKRFQAKKKLIRGGQATRSKASHFVCLRLGTSPSLKILIQGDFLVKKVLSKEKVNQGRVSN